jgi:hypothetical protein
MAGRHAVPHNVRHKQRRDRITRPGRIRGAHENLAETSQKIVTAFLESQSPIDTGPVDPLNVSEAFMELTRRILNNTARVPGDGDLQVLEDAPGSYVKVRTLSE